MPLSYNTRTEYRDDERNAGVVRVQSSKCFYSVAVSDEIHIVGPGVEETYQYEDLPSGLSLEGLALAAVLLFEESP